MVEAGVFLGVGFWVTGRRDPRRAMLEIPAIRGAIDRGVELCRPGYAWYGQAKIASNVAEISCFIFPLAKIPSEMAVINYHGRGYVAMARVGEPRRHLRNRRRWKSADHKISLLPGW